MESFINKYNYRVEIFNQTRFWVDEHRNEIEIIELSTKYLKNLIKFLENNANDFYLLHLKDINTRLEARDESLLIQERINHTFTGKQSWDYTPTEWLTSTALYRALLAELDLRK